MKQFRPFVALAAITSLLFGGHAEADHGYEPGNIGVIPDGGIYPNAPVTVGYDVSLVSDPTNRATAANTITSIFDGWSADMGSNNLVWVGTNTAAARIVMVWCDSPSQTWRAPNGQPFGCPPGNGGWYYAAGAILSVAMVTSSRYLDNMSHEFAHTLGLTHGYDGNTQHAQDYLGVMGSGNDPGSCPEPQLRAEETRSEALRARQYVGFPGQTAPPSPNPVVIGRDPSWHPRLIAIFFQDTTEQSFYRAMASAWIAGAPIPPPSLNWNQNSNCGRSYPHWDVTLYLMPVDVRGQAVCALVGLENRAGTTLSDVACYVL